MVVKVRWKSFHFSCCCASIKQDGCCPSNVNNKNIYSIQTSSPMTRITIEIIIITNLQPPPPLLLLLVVVKLELEQDIILAPTSLFVINQSIHKTDNHSLTKEQQQYQQTTIHIQKQQQQPTS